ncbi:MAG TPA: glucokinase [Pseudomonadaceae bacterium]|nr:glucokinase [Pseudomonadaceae bacterium]
MSHAAPVDIVADIGGTHARFACLVRGGEELSRIATLRCVDYPGIIDAIGAYLDQLDPDISVANMCLAVAGPVETDRIDLPNNPWTFSRRDLARQLGVELYVINDFTAQVLGVLTLDEHELQWLGSPRPQDGLVLAALGPGTGLGVAGLGPTGEIIPSEGGHLAFAPTTPHELALLQQLWKRYPRVSVERLLSGPGLSALYEANARLEARSVPPLAPEAVSDGARAGDPHCSRAMADFGAILGSVAGELAIALGARGGIYLCGGILPRIDGLFSTELLRARFNDKGRFTEYCSRIPVALVRAEHNGLRGCMLAVKRGKF